MRILRKKFRGQFSTHFHLCRAAASHRTTYAGEAEEVVCEKAVFFTARALVHNQKSAFAQDCFFKNMNMPVCVAHIHGSCGKAYTGSKQFAFTFMGVP
ncbi:hypothetical protein TNCV_1722911 [Trichonephila clavipes]|nr:hypothetical protein TNCV_1722911 [Trichonephila clavipes]